MLGTRHTLISVSPMTYNQLRAKLEDAELQDHILPCVGVGEILCMDGVALRVDTMPRCPVCRAGLVVCELCNTQWCLDHQSNPLVCPSCGDRPKHPPSHPL